MLATRLAGGAQRLGRPPLKVVAGLKSYSTTFPSDEDPLSEGGVWRGGLTVGGLWTDMKSSGGDAFRKMTAFNSTNYIDSLAFLSGFAANHSISGVLNSGQVTGLEAELYLRADISANVARGYEIDVVGSSGNLYLVVWLGSGTNTTSNFAVLAGPIALSGLAAGTVILASITGTVITVKQDGATVLTYDTVSDATKWSDGNPGIGGWNETGSASSQFNWSSIAANDL